MAHDHNYGQLWVLGMYGHSWPSGTMGINVVLLQSNGSWVGVCSWVCGCVIIGMQHGVIWAHVERQRGTYWGKLSESHTSGTGMYAFNSKYVFVCLWPYTVNFK